MTLQVHDSDGQGRRSVAWNNNTSQVGGECAALQAASPAATAECECARWPLPPETYPHGQPATPPSQRRSPGTMAGRVEVARKAAARAALRQRMQQRQAGVAGCRSRRPGPARRPACSSAHGGCPTAGFGVYAGVSKVQPMSVSGLVALWRLHPRACLLAGAGQWPASKAGGAGWQGGRCKAVRSCNAIAGISRGPSASQCSFGGQGGASCQNSGFRAGSVDRWHTPDSSLSRVCGVSK